NYKLIFGADFYLLIQSAPTLSYRFLSCHPERPRPVIPFIYPVIQSEAKDLVRKPTFHPGITAGI
ncbi:MAG: hypothetical protein WAO23_04465, partial [Dethiobacteria bacterium]